MFKSFRNRKQRQSVPCQPCPRKSSEDFGGRRVLTQVPKGCRCRIRRHMAGGAVRKRLLDLGFVPEAEVEMVRCATLGDPLEMRVGDYFVTLRKREADLIEVDESDL